MDTCYLISGEISKSCLLIILQKSQTKSEVTNYHSLKKKNFFCIHMGLWNQSFELLGLPAFKVPLQDIHIEVCLPPHTVRVQRGMASLVP